MHVESELPKYPPLFFVRFADSVRKILATISKRLTHPNVIMLEHIQHLWLLGAISVANELGIADILKSGPRNISELALLTKTIEDPLYRIMRTLSAEGIFRELDGRNFSNTSLSESMQKEELKFFIQHTLSSMQFRIISEIMHSAKTGKRSSELFVETGVFEHIGKSEHLNSLYNKAMTNTSKMQIAAILPSFRFNNFNHIVDVGGGQGFLLSAILRKFKTVHGTLFDLPQVVNDDEKQEDIDNFGGRLKIIPGSFFNEIPGGGDLYILKNILHTWNDEDCVMILLNIRKAMTGKARLMIIEAVIEEMNKPSWGKMSDVFMMAGPGGKERTKAEFQSILTAAGFSIEQIRKTVSPLSLIIAVGDSGN